MGTASVLHPGTQTPLHPDDYYPFGHGHGRGGVEEWLPDGVLLRDDPPLDVRALDAAGAVVTTCTVAIADTGTVVLDAGSGQGRRAYSLVPDHHVAVVRHDQVVAGMGHALLRLEPREPQTWISGPSATSDIDLHRIEGVHGPRRLDVVLVP